MPKSTAYANGVLNLVFQATTIANIAANTGTSPATTLTIALHTANPGAAGTQSTSEADYGGYARVTVARTSGGWTTSTAGSVSPQANIDFPASSGAGTTLTHFSIGTGVSNAMLYSGSISPTIAIGAAGITPRLTTATTITET